MLDGNAVDDTVAFVTVDEEYEVGLDGFVAGGFVAGGFVIVDVEWEVGRIVVEFLTVEDAAMRASKTL